MAESYHTDLRNARADAVTEFTGDEALFRVYTAAYATLLSEHVCGTPFAPAAVAGVLTFNPIGDGVGLANGNAAIARFYKADGTTVVRQGAVVTDSAGAGPIKLAQTGTSIALGQTVIVDSGTHTEGNL
jgi:hypothetical protein